jgi:[acyl-carrier-protein] S-malonyltransferase
MNYTFLFPGQGSQKLGMGQDFFDEFGVAKKRFEEADTILGRDLTSIIFNGPIEALTATQNTQPALFTLEAAITDVLAEKGIVPSYTAGHSLGEYSALYAAGFLSFADGLALVAKRGELMARAGADTPGTMAAIMGMPKDKIREVLTQECDGIVVCANENCSDQTVISGEVSAVTAACEKLKAAGAKRAILLTVSGAFHSPLMQKAADEFSSYVAKVTFSAPRCPVISNVTALPETDAGKIGDLLIRQLVSPVRWLDSMIHLSTLDYGVCVEAGPGSVLRNLAKKCSDTLNVVPCDTAENLYSLIR